MPQYSLAGRRSSKRIALLKKVSCEHLAQPINNNMRRFTKPLQESVFSPALARGWLHKKCKKVRFQGEPWRWWVSWASNLWWGKERKERGGDRRVSAQVLACEEFTSTCEHVQMLHVELFYKDTWYVRFWSFNSETPGITSHVKLNEKER